MTPDVTVDLVRQGLLVAITMVLILVTPGLIVGLLIAMFQAATQINEMSLTFIPKIMVTFLALVLAGPWLVRLIVDYTKLLIMEIPNLLG